MSLEFSRDPLTIAHSEAGISSDTPALASALHPSAALPEGGAQAPAMRGYGVGSKSAPSYPNFIPLQGRH